MAAIHHRPRAAPVVAVLVSGGTWGYQSSKLENRADDLASTVHALYVLAAIEHELDWGEACDTCLACAELRTMAALKQFFRDHCFSSEAAIAVAHDYQQNQCPRCLERRAAEKART